MDQLLYTISERIASFDGIKYIFVFVAVFIEGPLATLVAAAIAAGGVLQPVPVFFSAALGNLSADLTWYTIGYAGRATRVLHRLPWMRIRKEMIQKAEGKMQHHGIRMLILSKISFGVMAIPVLIAAGLLHLSWYRLLPALIGCEIIWSGALVLLGYYFTGYLCSVENILTRSTLIGLTAIGCMTGIYLVRRIISRLFDNGERQQQ